MNYPIDFVKRVKTVHPDWDKLNNAVANGSEFVGRYLDDSRYFSMSPTKIVEAFNQGREQDVLRAANEAVENTKLYTEWSDLYQAQQ